MTQTENTPVEGEVVGETTQSATPAVTAGAMGNEDYMAIGSLVLGLFNLCSWFIPLCGCPLTIAGIGLGIAGLKSTKYKGLAIAGIVLSSLGLIGTIINAIAGAYLGMQNSTIYNY